MTLVVWPHFGHKRPVEYRHEATWSSGTEMSVIGGLRALLNRSELISKIALGSLLSAALILGACSEEETTALLSYRSCRQAAAMSPRRLLRNGAKSPEGYGVFWTKRTAESSVARRRPS